MARPCLPPPPPARDTVPCEAPPESGEVSVIPARVSAGMLAEWAALESEPPPVGVRDLDAATRNATTYPGSRY
jgi:hypothetical protein